MNGFEDVKAIETLIRGDIVRNKGTGTTYVVEQTLGDTAIAVRTVVLSNPTEWEKMQ